MPKGYRKITEIIKIKIEPMILFKITPIDISNKTVLRLEVKPGTATPYYYVSDGNKIAFIRLGNETVAAPSHILNELILKGQRLSFDAMSSRWKFNEFSFTLFEATYKQRTRNSIEKPNDYLSFGLMENNGVLTNAGYYFQISAQSLSQGYSVPGGMGWIKGQYLMMQLMIKSMRAT